MSIRYAVILLAGVLTAGCLFRPAAPGSNDQWRGTVVSISERELVMQLKATPPVTVAIDPDTTYLRNDQRVARDGVRRGAFVVVDVEMLADRSYRAKRVRIYRAGGT